MVLDNPIPIIPLLDIVDWVWDGDDTSWFYGDYYTILESIIRINVDIHQSRLGYVFKFLGYAEDDVGESTGKLLY